MDHFDGRPIDQISEDEILEIIRTKIVEDQWLDFKAETWPRTTEGDFELLHDITAFANAEGGYLFVGITTRKRQGRDVATGIKDVSESTGLVQRIRSRCQESVDPPIRGLDVQSKTVQRSDGPVDIVGIRVPPSDHGPHAFRWRDATIFVSRYGTDVRSMPVSELGRQLSRHYFPESETNRRLGQLAAEVHELQRLLQDMRTAPPSTASGPLAATDVNQLIEYMDERFRQMTDRPSDSEESE